MSKSYNKDFSSTTAREHEDHSNVKEKRDSKLTSVVRLAVVTNSDVDQL